MNMKTLIAPAILILVTPIAAAAQDYNWSGGYGGLSYGTGTTSIDMEGSARAQQQLDATPEPAPGTPEAADYEALRQAAEGIQEDMDSRSFSGFLGYNLQVRRLVFGGELEYAKTMVESDFVSDADIASTRLKARLGFDAGRFMPYAFAGLTYMDVEDRDTGLEESGPLYNAGAGIDYAVNDRLRLGVEYIEDWTHDGSDTSVNLGASSVALRVSLAF